jgi:hypothetical protein
MADVLILDSVVMRMVVTRYIYLCTAFHPHLRPPNPLTKLILAYLVRKI